MTRNEDPTSSPDLSREIEAFIKQLKEEEKRQAAEDQRLGPWLPPEPEPISVPQRIYPLPEPPPSRTAPSRSETPSRALETAEQQIRTQRNQIRWLIVGLGLLMICGICTALPSRPNLFIAPSGSSGSSGSSISNSMPPPMATQTALWHMASPADAQRTLYEAGVALDTHNPKLALIQAYQALSYGIADNDLDFEQAAYTVLFDAVHQVRLPHRLEGPLRGFFHPHGMLFAISEWGYVSIWDPREPYHALTRLPSIHVERKPRLIFNQQGTHVLVYEARTVSSNQDVVRLYALDDEHQSLIPIELEQALHQTEMAMFSPDGTRLLTTYGLWHVDGRLIKQLASPEEKIYKAVGFNQDASRFFTLTNTGDVLMWSGEGVVLSQLATEGRQIVSVQFNAQGTHLFTVSNRSVAQIWNENGALVGTLAKVYAISHTTFSPDATRLVTADGGQTLRFWDRTGQLVQAVDIGLGQMDNIFFSPDGAQLLSVGCLRGNDNDDVCADPALQLWDSNGRLLNQLYGHRGQINSAVFSADSQYILTTSEDLTTRIWDRTGALMAVLPSSTPMSTASFSPDGAHIITIDKDGQTWLWKTHALPQFLTEHNNQANLLAYSQDGSRLLTASTIGRTAYLWDADGRLLFAKNNILQMSTIAMNSQNTRFVLGQSLWDDQGRLIASLEGPYPIHGMFSAQFTPDGSRLLTAYKTGEVYLWDGQDGTLLAALQQTAPSAVPNSAVFNHDGTRILSTNNTHQSVHLHNADGKLITILNGHRPHNISTALFSQDGEFILSITYNGDIRLWDNQGQLLRQQRSTDVTTAAFNWNGEYFFTASDFYVRLWNPDTLQFNAVVQGLILPSHILFNHRGTHLLVLETRGRVQLFAVNETGEARPISNWSMEGEGEVALFSPLGTYILAGDSLGMGYLLNDEGNLIMEIQTHANRGGLNAAAFHPNETYFVTPSGRDRARIWMPIDLLITEAERQLGLILTPQECQTHFGNNQPFFCSQR